MSLNCIYKCSISLSMLVDHETIQGMAQESVFVVRRQSFIVYADDYLNFCGHATSDNSISSW